MDLRAICNAFEQIAERVIDAQIELLLAGAIMNLGVLQRMGIGAYFCGDSARSKLVTTRGWTRKQFVFLPLDAAINVRRFITAKNEEAVARGGLLPRFKAAVKGRLFNIGTAIFGAKCVAIAAVIAEIGVTGDLYCLSDFKAFCASCSRRISGRVDGKVEVIESDLGRRIREVRCVGADRQTFVAGDAVECFQVRIDAARHFPIGSGAKRGS